MRAKTMGQCAANGCKSNYVVRRVTATSEREIILIDEVIMFEMCAKSMRYKRFTVLFASRVWHSINGYLLTLEWMKKLGAKDRSFFVLPCDCFKCDVFWLLT